MAAPFQNCTIALSGRFTSNHGTIAGQIERYGGTYASRVTAATTHLVASQQDFENNSGKVNLAAELAGVKIVSYEWILDSVEGKAKVDEGRYLMAVGGAKTALDQTIGKGKKRAAKSSDDEDIHVQQPPAKKRKDGQKAHSDTVQVWVDDVCPLATSHHVYIDAAGTIFDASLNQTDSGNNHNKAYRIQLLAGTDYRVWTRWGRVGERGQSALLGDGDLTEAVNVFDKKFRDKTGHTWANRLHPPKAGKYTFIERDYGNNSEDDYDEIRSTSSRRGSKASIGTQKSSSTPLPESKLPKAVQNLMELIFNQNYFAATMKEMDYDANKLPLGKLSKRTLMTGFERLKELAELFANPALADEKHNMSYAQAIEEISNSFYTIIPHAFGRQRPPLITTEERLKKEITLLESLSDMEIANEIMKDAKSGAGERMHSLDRHFAGLGLEEMTPIPNSTNEFKMLEDYLLKTRGQTHDFAFKVQDIFRVERKGEHERFYKSPYGKAIADRRLLWHGSRCTNFGGILSQGLRIAPPEAPVTGYMFGKGVYLADISSKSANYCYPGQSGGTAILLLCEVELGKPMLELTDADYEAGEKAKRQGCFSTWGKGLTAPAGWKDASCVHEALSGVMMPDTRMPPTTNNLVDPGLLYNEYIVYDVAQIRLRYLLRVGMKYDFSR